MVKTKTYPPHTYPWMVLRHPWRRGEERFARDFNAARKIIQKDLDAMMRNFRHLQAEDSIGLIEQLIKDMEMLSPWQRGSQWVEGLVDPPSGVKYRVELVRREEF